LIKLPGDISQPRKGTTPFKAWNYFITDEILDNIVEHTNQYVPIQPHSSLASDARLTDKFEMKAVFGLLCLAGALRSNKQSLEKLKGTDGDGSEKLRLVMNHRCFTFLIRCILE
jgi:hypothetical protein